MDDPERMKVLLEADQNTAEHYRRFLSNKGACFLSKTGKGDEVVPTPINVTLLPTPVSRSAYEHVKSVQVPLNQLIENVSKDVDYVTECVQPTTSVDYLAKRLLDIYHQCKDDESKITLGMYRHDYMFHTRDPRASGAISEGQFKMVEVNLMSAALLGTGNLAMQLHSNVLGLKMPDRVMPFERTLPPMVKGVSEAFKLYNRPNSVFLFLVAPDDFNWFDQQKIIDELWEMYGIRSLKMTYEEFMRDGKVDDDRRYWVRGSEIAIIYFRTHWNESHYTTEEHWEVRLKMEKSRAIVVPNIRHQVLNLKLFQQAFLNPGVVERYLNAKDSSNVRTVFAQLHQLSLGPEGDRAAQLAFDSPQGWVLKPSREGGGNNFWDDEMLEKLRELKGSEKREAYVLMEKLRPPHVPNRVVRNRPNSSPELSEIFDTTAELGLHCVFVADSLGKVVMNEVAGPLMRTKPASCNEGGVALGTGVMDSVVFDKEK